MKIKPLQKQEQGVGHILVVLLIVVVLAAIGFAGWKVMDKNKTPKASTVAASTTNNNEKSAASTSCEATYHDANLCKFEAHDDISKLAYKATITSTSPSNSGTLTLESDGKGNTSESFSSGGTMTNVIFLGGNSYMQTGSGGVWYEYPKGASNNMSESMSDPAKAMNIVLSASTITYKSMGTVVCGSLTCYKYEVTDKTTPDSTQYVLFDTKQYMLREWISVDKTNGTTTMMLTYPASVTITKPSPVQPYTSKTQ